jgi:protein TonB
MQIIPENDTTYYCRYYQKLGPMVKEECYKDSDLTVPQGMFTSYHSDGWIESSGYVKGGKKDGIWYKYGDSAKVVAKSFFDSGKWVKTVDYLAKKESYPDGVTKDIEEKKDSSEEKHVYVKAEYPGGEKAWSKYIVDNLITPDRFQNIIRSGACGVVVLFSVGTNGGTQDLQLAKSCEWSADAEVFKLIKGAVGWMPASKDGQKVIYRQKQLITFQVTGG